jgi:GntR family transcriptional repressor for pyruvate dehydrogenase complex
MLWAQGLLETRAGKESVVRAPNDEALQLFFERVVKAQEVGGLIDLLEVRRELEQMSARLATERRTEADLSDLGRILQSMEESLDRPDTYSRMDVEFHIQLAVCSHNSFLFHLTSSIRNSLIGVIKELRIREYHASTADVHRYHRAVHDAVREQDAGAAERAMGDHFDDVIRRLRRVLTERAGR